MCFYTHICIPSSPIRSLSAQWSERERERERREPLRPGLSEPSADCASDRQRYLIAAHTGEPETVSNQTHCLQMVETVSFTGKRGEKVSVSIRFYRSNGAIETERYSLLIGLSLTLNRARELIVLLRRSLSRQTTDTNNRTGSPL